MTYWVFSRRILAGFGILLLAVLAGGVALLSTSPAAAHCDSISGPVVAAARQALDTGNVDLVLPYVKPDAEAELTAAFQRTRAVRGVGGEAGSLADRWFFETAVRLHRAGEGAAYTGLKEQADFGPALEAAEQALESGSLEAVHAVLDEALRSGVAQKYQAVRESRERAAREGTVAANRERVEAELGFEIYVDAVYQAALGKAVHGEEHEGAVTLPAQVGASCPR